MKAVVYVFFLILSGNIRKLEVFSEHNIDLKWNMDLNIEHESNCIFSLVGQQMQEQKLV